MTATVVATDKDIGEIRNSIDIKRLESVFNLSLQQVDSNSKIHLGPGVQWPIVSGPITVKQFVYGQSNPTYLVIDSKGQKFSLRRKPSPNAKLLSKKAHNIEREFWINYDIEKLNTGVPIAKPYFLCEDESYVGVVFYVSKFVEGYIFHNPDMPTLSKENKLKVWKSVVESLIKIHQLPVNQLTHSFPSAKKSSKNYFQRQVKALGAIEKIQSSQPKTSRITGFDEISKYLFLNSPEDAKEPILIHGDFKIDNFIIDLKTFTVVAVLDWELSTLGSPIFDLANLLQNYYLPTNLNKGFLKVDLQPNEQFVMQILKLYTDLVIFEKHPKDNGNLKNWLTSSGYKQEFNQKTSSLVFRYWNLGKAFACYRVAVIIQGIHARVINGTNSSGEAKRFLNSYHTYSELALQFISEASKSKL